jgi:hypothetical protein
VILVALVSFGSVSHAQKPRSVASDSKSCDSELAICQALHGIVGGKQAKDAVRLAATTPSSESAGALSHSPAAVWPSHARAACSQTARAVQGRVRSSARTRAARCSWPVARSIQSRTQRAAQPC